MHEITRERKKERKERRKKPREEREFIGYTQVMEEVWKASLEQ